MPVCPEIYNYELQYIKYINIKNKKSGIIGIKGTITHMDKCTIL